MLAQVPNASMQGSGSPRKSKRAALLAGFLTVLLLPACAGQTLGDSTPTASSPAAPAAPSPDRSDAPTCAGRPTPAQTEGPFFKAGSPERKSLVEPDIAGTRLALTGRVLTVDCKPVAGALLDFWQADASGAYDNRGYRLRGHQLAGADGRYFLDTILPGEYPGRTAHIHVKIQAPGRAALTTQLYFPGRARNQQDSIFDPALVMDVRDTADGKRASFDFVVAQR